VVKELEGLAIVARHLPTPREQNKAVPKATEPNAKAFCQF